MTDGRTCLREHEIKDKELLVADSVEAGVRINCVNDDCGPHEIYYHDEGPRH